MKQSILTVLALAGVVGLALRLAHGDGLVPGWCGHGHRLLHYSTGSTDLMSLLTPRVGGIPLTGNSARLIPGGWLTEVLTQKVPHTAACFAEGTPWELVDYYNQLLYGHAGDLAYFTTTRWPGAQGTPLDLRWSFVPDGLSIGSGNGEPVAPSELFSRLDTLFGGNRALWISLFQQCFDRWSALTGLTYTRVTDGVNDWDDGGSWGNIGGPNRGDVRICMKNIDGAFNILAYNHFPSGGLSPGDMVLDRSENWANPTNNYRFMRNIIMHEHGHGIGLLHVCPTNNTKLMEPFLNTNFDGLQHDDVRGGNRHYGDPFEPNDSVAEAYDVGTLTLGTPVTLGAVPPPAIGNTSILSMDGDGKLDFFRFAIPATATVTVTLAPRGLNYDSSSQVGGSCTSGNFIDSLSIADLGFQILASDGTTSLAIASSNPAGQGESTSLSAIPADTYYIRVFETNSFFQSQLYELTISAQLPTPNPPFPDFATPLRNRYISFVPNSPGEVVAFRIDKTTVPTGSCFAGPPDSQGNSQCLPTPTFRVWSEPTVHVGDCIIVPVANYQVRATFDNIVFAAPVAVQTAMLPSNNSKLWGDVCGPFDGFLMEWSAPDQFTNVHDIVAMSATASGLFNALPFSRANVQGVSASDPCLNAVTNTADLFAVVQAAIGNPYPFTTDPATCPSCPPLP